MYGHQKRFDINIIHILNTTRPKDDNHLHQWKFKMVYFEKNI